VDIRSLRPTVVEVSPDRRAKNEPISAGVSAAFAWA
jgi:hypothetical protein